TLGTTRRGTRTGRRHCCSTAVLQPPEQYTAWIYLMSEDREGWANPTAKAGGLRPRISISRGMLVRMLCRLGGRCFGWVVWGGPACPPPLSGIGRAAARQRHVTGEARRTRGRSTGGRRATVNRERRLVDVHEARARRRCSARQVSRSSGVGGIGSPRFLSASMVARSQ